MAADIVGFPHCPFGHDLIQRTGMIFDIQPVTYLRAVAVYRQRLAIQRVQNGQRDQLLRDVVRAVVVRAVGDEGR